jgi:hypothetical protein
MDDDDAARLIAGSRLIAGDLDQLGYGLSRLRPDHSGYITAEDYERITGEQIFHGGPQDDGGPSGTARMHNPDSTDRTARLFHQSKMNHTRARGLARKAHKRKSDRPAIQFQQGVAV